MGIRSTFAQKIGRLTKIGLQTFTRGGSSLPGKIALQIDPEILTRLTKDYDVIMVTGTNGKTLTTALITRILKQKYGRILTNPTGANMKQGIVSAFLDAPRPAGKALAVMEVDEANLAYLTTYIQPKVVVLTNIFRDQMDRFGEIYTTYQKILDGLANTPDALVIANGDAPIFHPQSLANAVVYYGFDHLPDGDVAAHYNTDGVVCPVCEKIIRYRFITYGNLGKYACPHCDFQRPALDHRLESLSEMTLTKSTFVIDGETFTLPIGGLYNVYNALAAYALAKVYDVGADHIRQGLSSGKRIFGRQEQIAIGETQIMLHLIKNPVGFNQIVSLLQTDEADYDLALLLNDRSADGEDVSWIWDADVESLVAGYDGPIVIGGLRQADLQIRLEVAGVKLEQMHLCGDIADLDTLIGQLSLGRVHVLATYTAMLDLRKALASKGYIKEGM